MTPTIPEWGRKNRRYEIRIDDSPRFQEMEMFVFRSSIENENENVERCGHGKKLSKPVLAIVLVLRFPMNIAI
jgi:hypothetical protein